MRALPGRPEVAPQGEALSETMVEQFMAYVSGSHEQDQLLTKMTTEQIGQMLDQSEKDAQRSFTLQSKAMGMVLWVIVAFSILALAICWLFLAYQKGDLLRELFALLLGLGSGGIGGFAGGRLTAPKSS